ncbi:hypothetical protein L6164_000584 [Bauhinia variegata]|uniref:Uncharacterized protein n=1 Tax=Bauhinia variegata TaxID=167791 RepID=A0ACB9Q8Z7_BAUVA|nr:hypothetical protein L6164_000584 [Bauhinia variegata]
MVFGKINSETTKYEAIKSTTDYEISNYASCVTAQVTHDPSQFNGNKDEGFMNPDTGKIDITAHVIKAGEAGEKMVTRQSILPEKYGKADEALTPVDDRVIDQGGEGKEIWVVMFRGVAIDEVVGRQGGKAEE